MCIFNYNNNNLLFKSHKIKVDALHLDIELSHQQSHKQVTNYTNKGNLRMLLDLPNCGAGNRSWCGIC